MLNPAHLSGNTGPSLSIDFTTGTLDPRLTFTRASSALYFDATGTLQSASTNVPRFDYGPTPGGVTNWIKNNSMVGAVAGTPGTPPTNWGVPALTGGSITIVGTGIESGIPYVDMRFFGTPSATGQAFALMNGNVPAIPGQVWTLSSYLSLVAGDFTNVTQIGVQLNNVGGGSGTVRATATITSASLASQRVIGTTVAEPAGTTNVQPFFVCSVTSGLAVDFVIRIGGPQLELAASAGTLVLTTSAAANTGATPLGLLLEEARTNSLRNNSMTGFVVGTPGTLPTNWSQSNNTGLVANVAASGTDHGIPYVDLKFTGTTATGTTQTIPFEVSNNIAALQNQIWTGSVYLSLVGGSLSNVASIRFLVQVLNAATATVSQSQLIATVTSASLASQRSTITYTIPDATAAWVRTYVQVIFNTAPVAVDLTLRIGAPCLELGAWVTTPILTTTAAVTRSLDLCSMSLGSWFNSAGYSAMCQAMCPAVNTTSNEIEYQFEGAAAARVMIYVASAAFALFNSTGALNSAITGTNVAGTTHKTAAAFGLARQAGSVNGGAITSFAGSLPSALVTLRFGSNGGTTQPYTGYLQKFYTWRRVLTDAELQKLSR